MVDNSSCLFLIPPVKFQDPEFLTHVLPTFLFALIPEISSSFFAQVALEINSVER